MSIFMPSIIYYCLRKNFFVFNVKAFKPSTFGIINYNTSVFSFHRFISARENEQHITSSRVPFSSGICLYFSDFFRGHHHDFSARKPACLHGNLFQQKPPFLTYNDLHLLTGLLRPSNRVPCHAVRRRKLTCGRRMETH